MFPCSGGCRHACTLTHTHKGNRPYYQGVVFDEEMEDSEFRKRRQIGGVDEQVQTQRWLGKVKLSSTAIVSKITRKQTQEKTI